MEMSAAQRVMRARMGGLTTAALGHTTTEAARKAFDARFVDQVDPLRVLPPSERARRAEAARRLYMTRLALRSSVVRGKKKAVPALAPGTAQEARRDGAGRPPAA
jgi:hypothetical protein